MIMYEDPKYAKTKEVKLSSLERSIVCVGLELYRRELEAKFGDKHYGNKEVLEGLLAQVFDLEAKMIGIEGR